ncbi:MAG: hypothetical protein ABH950_00095 [Candidatus Altiarchaeota archaeon]
MKFVSSDLVVIDRELSDLDKFAIDFVKVLRNHTPYVIVSGYVAIMFGRSRGSEDVDIIIPPFDFSAYSKLIGDLKSSGFYCLQADEIKEIYEYVNEKIPLRFAKRNTVIPNIELKCVKNKVEELSLDKPITVRLGSEELFISNLELQVAFKEEVLKSPKDIEDARHLRNVAKKHLDLKKIEEYKRLLNEVYR